MCKVRSGLCAAHVGREGAASDEVGARRTQRGESGQSKGGRGELCKGYTAQQVPAREHARARGTAQTAGAQTLRSRLEAGASARIFLAAFPSSSLF